MANNEPADKHQMKEDMHTANLPYKVSGYKESRLIRSHSLGFATAFC